MKAELGSIVNSTSHLLLDSDQKKDILVEVLPVHNRNSKREIETIEINRVPEPLNFKDTAAIAFLSPTSNIGDDASKSAAGI